MKAWQSRPSNAAGAPPEHDMQPYPFPNASTMESLTTSSWPEAALARRNIAARLSRSRRTALRGGFWGIANKTPQAPDQSARGRMSAAPPDAGDEPHAHTISAIATAETIESRKSVFGGSTACAPGAWFRVVVYKGRIAGLASGCRTPSTVSWHTRDP